ncbi:hypothetical protein AB0P15_05110 [Streptomyces sp. NPDC087917]|uniref:hypothetical protein n=1 Tax=unclassified Streptomyces TaxID=2593676 RepID=UPI003415401C
MRHPLHIAVPVSAPRIPPAAPARHRKPRPVSVLHASVLRAWSAVPARVPPARRLAAGLGLASVVAATALTAVVDPASPVAPDRAPARQSSTFAQVSGD